MSEFQIYECEQCGEEFRALDGANAAVNGYCSPRCEHVGRGLD